MAKSDLAVKAAGVLLAVSLPPLLTACGSRGELIGTVARNDAAVSETGDAQATTPPRFGPPVLAAELAHPTAIDEDPTFTGDLLELYFMSTRGGTRDIWSSRRIGTGAEAVWGPPSLVGELSSPASDWAPAVALDGLTIWITTDRDGPSGHIWQATRPSRADPWGPPQPVSELASTAVDFAPSLDASGTILFFASNRPGVGAFDIYSSNRATSQSPWGPPALAPGINTDGDELDPFVGQGGLVVFFTSMRLGEGDILWAARPSTTETFPPPSPLVDLNSSSYDSDTTVSADLTYLMFSSTRTGNAEIYETRALR